MIPFADLARTHRAAFTYPRPWHAAEFDELLQSPTCFITGNAQCFALTRVIVDEAELLTIATHPDHQRHGLARTCMVNWQQMARARGAIRAFLEVAADNAAAIALYQTCGFETDGTRPGYYHRDGQTPVDALLMARALP